MRMNYQNKKSINFNLKDLSESRRNHWSIEKVAIKISNFIDNVMSENAFSGRKEKFDLIYIKNMFNIDNLSKEILSYVSQKLRSKGYVVSIKNNHMNVTWNKY